MGESFLTRLGAVRGAETPPPSGPRATNGGGENAGLLRRFFLLRLLGGLLLLALLLGLRFLSFTRRGVLGVRDRPRRGKTNGEKEHQRTGQLHRRSPWFRVDLALSELGGMITRSEFPPSVCMLANG